MKENMITVLKIEVGEPPEIKEIPNELSCLQHEVSGLIECVYLDDGSIAVCNEEGKLNGMEPNRRLGADIICGPFFICGDSLDGDFASLSDEQIQKYSEKFAEIPGFTGKEPELEPRIVVFGFDFMGGIH